MKEKVNDNVKENTLKYIDTHSHIHFEDFNDDREDLLSRMSDAMVGTIVIGTNETTTMQVVKMAQEHQNIWACIGVHPNTHEDFSRVKSAILVIDDTNGKRPPLAILPKCVVAVGECGLDYFRFGGIDDADPQAKETEKKRQKALFKEHIEFAVQHQLPLMLHIRSSNNKMGQSTNDAHNDALDILEIYKKKHGDALRLHCHFTTFGIELGKKFINLGATFGIPGVVTYKNAKDLQEFVQWLPLEKILSETDAPYAAPVPHRGKRNEPVFVIDTVNTIADLRGEDREVVRKQLVQNAKRVFRL